MKKKYVVAFFLGFGLVFVLPFVGTVNGEDFLETDFTVEGYVCEFATKNKIRLDNTVFSPSGDNCTQEVMDFAQKTSCATEYENMDWAIGKKRKAKLRAEYLECVFSLKEKLVSKVDSLLEEQEEQRKRKAEEAAQAERERLEEIAREERLKKEEEERQKQEGYVKCKRDNCYDDEHYGYEHFSEVYERLIEKIELIVGATINSSYQQDRKAYMNYILDQANYNEMKNQFIEARTIHQKAYRYIQENGSRQEIESLRGKYNKIGNIRNSNFYTREQGDNDEKATEFGVVRLTAIGLKKKHPLIFSFATTLYKAKDSKNEQEIRKLEKEQLPKEEALLKKRKQLENNLLLLQTWDDFFINNEPQVMRSALKGLQIREWLMYNVEYNLPQKLIPEYKAKVEKFLQEWGI